MKIHNITTTVGGGDVDERGDLEIKDDMVLPCTRDHPVRTLILDLVMWLPVGTLSLCLVSILDLTMTVMVDPNWKPVASLVT